tara:strand:- start:2244 stop:3296 length:1053 start_codon:yes stop_codon:yes gene_type:complete
MKILISSYTGLGNFILKTPMISSIRDEYPSAIIDIITANGLGIEPILKKNSLINDVIVLNNKASLIQKIIFFMRLRKSKYDLVLLPFDSQPLFLIFGSYISNIKKRVMHLLMHDKKRSIFSILMPWTSCVQVLPNRHEIDLNYDLFEFYLNKPMRRQYQTFVNIDKDENVLHRFQLRKHKYIVVQVGAANGAKSAKKWSIDNFKGLIGKINTNYPDYQVTLVGDLADYQNDIKSLEGVGLDFINTAGLTSINEVVNLLYFSELVVSHDSGIMHLANALNCNLIALYGPTDYTRTRPLGQKSTVLYSKTSCFCKMYNFGGNEIDLHHQFPNCMSGISVKNVMDEVDKLISE